MIAQFLFFACIGTVMWLFSRNCLYAGRVHINPIFGLLMGVSFYVLLPCFIIIYFTDRIGQWTVFDNEFAEGNAEQVLLFTIILLLAFGAGGAIFRLAKSRRRVKSLAVNSNANMLHARCGKGVCWPSIFVMVISVLIFLALAISVREVLFLGYDSDVLANESVWSLRGAMSSAYSMFYVAMCAFILRRQTKMTFVSLWALVLTFGLLSLILLSMGARMYVAMALLMLLSLQSFSSRGIPVRNLAIFMMGGGVTMGVLGVLRAGSIDGLESIIQNIALEPLLTSISLYTLLSANEPIWIGQPHMFIADFQAVIPSFLFAGKVGLFDRLHDYNYSFESPVGGYHLYFSSLINFGYIGTALIALWLGYILSRVSSSMITGTDRVATLLMGMYLSGALAFTVFRDPFFISIVKNVLLTGILLPVVIIGLDFRIRKLPRVASRVAR